MKFTNKQTEDIIRTLKTLPQTPTKKRHPTSATLYPGYLHMHGTLRGTKLYVYRRVGQRLLSKDTSTSLVFFNFDVTVGRSHWNSDIKIAKK